MSRDCHVAMTDERELLAACFDRKKASWDEFVERYSRLVYGAIKQTLRVYHVEPTESAVEDLFQDFFVSVLRDDFKKLREFRGERGCTLASWLRMVATRLTIDFLRKTKNYTVGAIEPAPVNAADPSGELIRKEKEKLMAQLIRTLPAADRLLIDLSFREELAPEDIAVILGTSINAVYTRKSRILAKLKEAIKQVELL